MFNMSARKTAVKGGQKPQKKQPASKKPAGKPAKPKVVMVRTPQPRRPALKGRGGYYDKSGNYNRGFDPNYGSQLGGILGNGVQSLAEVFGFGDYSVKKNSMSQLLDGGGPPSIANFGKGDATMVRHREYIGDLKTGPIDAGTGSTAFSLLEFNINPGTSKLFPWLSRMANLFQFFEINGMVVELKTTSSNYATNMALGTMFVATNYNTLDNSPTNKIELLNMEFSTSSVPSCSQIHLIECARKFTVQDKLYVTSDSNYKGGDPRLFNLGTTYIGSYGCPAADTSIAEMWVSYELSLYRPIPGSANDESKSALFNTNSFGGSYPFGGANNDWVLDPGSSTVYEVDTASLANKMIVKLPNRIAAYRLYWTGTVNPVNAAGVTINSPSSSFHDCVGVPWAPSTSAPMSLITSRVTSASVGNVLIWSLLVRVDALLPGDALPQVVFSGTLASATYATSWASLLIDEFDYDFATTF